MIEREESSPVSVRKQCELLELNRSSLYYEPVPISEENLHLMNVIDELYKNLGQKKIEHDWLKKKLNV